MKNSKNNYNPEKLWNVIDKVDDKYIEEALQFKNEVKTSDKNISKPTSKKQGKYLIKGIAAVAAVIIMIISSGIYYDYYNDNDEMKGVTDSGKEHNGLDALINKSILTVSIMAAENENLILEEGVEVRINSAEYSPMLSSVPAMPFTFKCENDSNEEVYIRVSTREDGMLMRYEVDSEGIWSCVESGQTLECKSGETLYWKKVSDNEDYEYYGEINVDVYKGEECMENKCINIYSEDNNILRAVMTSKHGISYKDNVIYSMNSMSDVSVYVPDICYCNEEYIMFANLGGLIIYDRINKRIASVIDLQEMDCNNINEGYDFGAKRRTTRIMPYYNGIIIFNEYDGEVEENAYVCTWENGMERLDINLKKLSDKNMQSELMNGWNDYCKNNIKDTWNHFSNVICAYDIDTTKYSCNSIIWKNGNGKDCESFLLETKSDGKEKYYIVSVGENGRETEEVQISFESRTEALPEFVYTGEDEVMKVLCEYGMDEYGEKFREDGVKIVFPCIYSSIEKDDKLIVFVNMYEAEFIKVGNVLQDTAGGEGPMRITLKQTDDGYKVEEVIKAEDGSYYGKSIEEFTKGYGSVRDMYFDNKENTKLRNKMQKDFIKMYVDNNQLDVKYYKEYGRDKVELE